MTKGRTQARWRALQLTALTLSFLFLCGYWILTRTAEGYTPTTSLSSFTGTPPHFTLLLAGRDIAYCYHHQPCKDQNSEVARRATRTDTIMLIKVSALGINVLTIPRDTEASGRKINAAYAFGGPEELKVRVEEITGEHIDAYAVVRTTYVERIVDALGGLDVNVPETGMTWIDSAAGVNFQLTPGQHHLAGKDAVLYMRVRKGVGDDYGRMDHQKTALTQLLNKLRTPSGLAAVAPLLLNFRTDVETNADPLMFEAIKPFLNDYQPNFATLPTTEIPGTTKLAPDREALRRLWNEEPTEPLTEVRAQVRIYDASGIPELGQKVAWALETYGIHVSNIEVEPKSLESSQVFTLNEITSAQHIAQFLDLPRLQGLRFRVKYGEVGVLLTHDAKERYAELCALPVTLARGEQSND